MCGHDVIAVGAGIVMRGVCRECVEMEVGRAIMRTAGMGNDKRVTFVESRRCRLCGCALSACNSFNEEMDVPLLYLHFSVCPMSACMLLRAYGARVDIEATIRQIVDTTVLSLYKTTTTVS